jgi:hypothetical protein
MKFIIGRTSLYGNYDDKPHEKAYEGTYKGLKDKVEKCWFIDIETLEDLCEFKKSVNEDLILTTHLFDNEYHKIEIYDDWRE